MGTGSWIGTRIPRIVAGFLALTAMGMNLPAHHIMGIPHYAYDKNYPQAPVITYKVAAGPYIVELTGYPGKPIPGEMAQMHAYMYRKNDKSDVYGGKILARVDRERFGKRETVFGPISTRFEEKLHKFSPVYKEAGKYIVRFEMTVEGQPFQIDFPILVGDPENPWKRILLWASAALLLFILLRAVKIKRDRLLAAAG